MNQSSEQEELRPVAYDAEGKPLYASPQEAIQASELGAGAVHETHVKFPSHQPSQFVHVTRAIDPKEAQIPPVITEKHEESAARFPELNLSPHEYIVAIIPRHPIGLVGPAFITTFCVAAVMSVVFNYDFLSERFGFSMNLYGLVLLGGVMLSLLFLLGGYAAIWVFINNRFFLTNESVIQEIQTGLFRHKEQTVSLANIEDASYDQVGIIQSFFNYGSIRLSTEGDETTYRFAYAARPKHYLSILNNAVEAFKNGRPVGPSVEVGLKQQGELAFGDSAARKAQLSQDED